MTAPQTFEALIEPQLDGLYRLAYRLTGTVAAAENLLREFLIALYRRRDELPDLANLRERLRRILYNQFLDGMRRHASGQVPSTDEQVAELGALAETLANLSLEHRLILLLHDAEGLTLDELHDVTGVPRDTLESRLDLARERARAVLPVLPGYPVAGPSQGFFERAVTQAMQTPAEQRAGRPPRLVAAGFLGAFALSILTVILTGLYVRGPGSQAAREPTVSAVTLAQRESRTVNLVFDSAAAMDGVVLTVELPRGVELAGRAGERRVTTPTTLSAGNNILPLELVAIGSRGGRLVARVTHGRDERVFYVDVTIR